MSFASQTVTARFQQATQTKITNLSIPTANTEVSHALVSNLKQLIVKARNFCNIKAAFVSSESATKYITIHKGGVLDLKDLDFSSTTLYLQTNQNSSTIEILEIY